LPKEEKEELLQESLVELEVYLLHFPESISAAESLEIFLLQFLKNLL